MRNRRRCLLLGFAGLAGLPIAARSVRAASAPIALDAPEAMAQLQIGEAGALLAVSGAGRLWQLEGRAWRQRGEGLDPRAPIAAGHGRIAGRSASGGLFTLEAGRPKHGSAPRLAPYAGCCVLPLGIVGVAEGAGGRAHAVRLEPTATGEWRETARSIENVLPDARPLQVDLDGPLAAAGNGHIVVLGGPDSERYRHGVLGDAIEATRALYLERHDLAALRTLDLPAPHVLEDIAPRPIAWEGATGLLTMRAGPQGAQLAVLAADPARRDALRIAALGEPIGTPARWMAASTDGRRIVAVHTPHIGGVLIEYRPEGSALRARRIGAGFSTHALGSRELDLAAWSGGALVVPSQDRSRLTVLSVETWSPVAAHEFGQQIIATRAWRFGMRAGVAVLTGDGQLAFCEARP